jgi:large subunit ribosomal protein L21e
MTQRTGGFRRKTRSKLRKNVRDKGKISIRDTLQKFDINDKVALVAEPAVQKGMHHPRFQGRIAIITGKQGEAYKVTFIDGSLKKTQIVHPVHLRRQ